MLFNSTAFIVFFIVFMCTWPIMRRRDNTRWIYITIMSFFFYGWWNWKYMFLLAGTGLIDFFAGLAMEKYPKRKGTILFFSLFGNLGPLIFYKYVPFFATNINSIVQVFGYELNLPVVQFILPVGISFYTFLSMSYAIDIYRGELTPTHNVFHYFALLSLFPHLVAGPIVRAADILPQLMKVTKTTEQMRWDGLSLVSLGYFKKVVIADNLAPAVNAAFASAVPLDSAAYWWVIMAMFAFQIYCDFSGYSDIARGLAKWIGIEFMVNFDHPYISTSFREFWSRWHISLSTWFRD
jgi:D-alanyl-lipoteichoic acid acyltransferase DltB (MBOAT superfamily)